MTRRIILILKSVTEVVASRIIVTLKSVEL